MSWTAMQNEPRPKRALFEAAVLFVAMCALVIVLGAAVYVVAFS